MRALAFAVLVGLAGSAAAAPWRLDTDVDGPLRLELDAHGKLKIDARGQTATIELAKAVTRATLSASKVKGVPTIVAEIDEQAVVLQPDGATWKQVLRTPVGGVGEDREHTIELDATPIGILRYQGRAGYRRCDGKPAYLLAEGYVGGKFRKLSRIPTGIADDAPVVTAKVDAQPAARPVIYQARVASHQHGSGDDVGALGIPSELDDGKPLTFWSEDFAGSGGEGQFFTFEARIAKTSAAQLRIVPGNPTTAATLRSFNRPRRLGVVWAGGAVHVDLPDAANDSLGTAYVADLPGAIGGCVTVVLESTYAGPTNTTAIGELEVFADGERGGGGDAMLAAVVAEGGDGERSAAQELARHGASGVAAIENELGKTGDEAARRRLVRALFTIKDPAAGPAISHAIGDFGVRNLNPDDIAALGELGQTETLKQLVANDTLTPETRVVAVAALAKLDPKVLVDFAGTGPRILRHAVIDALSRMPAAALVPAAQAASGAAGGDLWRAVARRARSAVDERPAVLAAMTAALAQATDYDRRYRLVEGIAALGDADALRALAVLLRGLPDDAQAAAYKQAAARAIGDSPRPEALELVLTFARDPDPGVRLAALGALVGAETGTAGPWHRAEDADSIDRAIGSALASDRWPEVRRRAAQVLGSRCARPGPARALADSVRRDPELGVRGDALAGLVDCKAPGTAELLAKLWNDDKQPLELRERAVDLAVPLGDRALADKLVRELKRWRGASLESAEALALAQNAAYAVGRLAPAGAAEVLESGLGDASFPEIVASSATALGLLGPACPARAKAKLRELARGAEDPSVAAAASRAAAICGK